MLRRRQSLAVLLIAALAVCRGGRAEDSTDVYAARADLETQYAQRLAELAESSRAQGLEEEARRTQDWIPLRHPRLIYSYTLPDKGGVLDRLDGDPQWRERFGELRREQAQRLFELALRTLDEEKPSLAMELANQAAREDPDHERARWVLGFREHEGFWRTPYEIAQLRRGMVHTERFGWLPESRMEKYADGQRYYRGAWIPAERDAQLHADIDSGWRIETEHFSIVTNHSLEAGVQLGRRLETLSRVWRQLFAGYWASTTQLKTLFAGRPARAGARRKHVVMFLRNKEEYAQTLRRFLPEGVNTTGIYVGDRNTAYFYNDPEADYGTLYHEATHQLFSESRTTDRSPGANANFWILEGVACYMESLVEGDGYAAVGGVDAYRVQDARYYLFSKNFYLPLADLASLGMSDLQRHPQIGMLYAQSAGLADFLLTHDGGKHRDALLEYLTLIYVGRDRADTLFQTAGADPTALDRQYREFMVVTDDDLGRLTRPQNLTYLTLGRSQITDAGLRHLADLPAVQWIDLSHTPITDAGLRHLETMGSLKTLDLTGTAVTGAGLARLKSNLPQLTVTGP